VVKPGDFLSRHASLNHVFGWYDFLITTDADPGFQYHFAGHVETGKDSASDPALGGIRHGRELEKESERVQPMSVVPA
jgi:phospholipase C